jgi:hypothetical protein
LTDSTLPDRGISVFAGFDRAAKKSQLATGSEDGVSRPLNRSVLAFLHRDRERVLGGLMGLNGVSPTIELHRICGAQVLAAS